MILYTWYQSPRGGAKERGAKNMENTALQVQKDQATYEIYSDVVAILLDSVKGGDVSNILTALDDLKIDTTRAIDLLSRYGLRAAVEEIDTYEYAMYGYTTTNKRTIQGTIYALYIMVADRIISMIHIGRYYRSHGVYVSAPRVEDVIADLHGITWHQYGQTSMPGR